MLPSDTWKTADELVDHWTGAHKLWLKIDFDAVENVACALRVPRVPCTANRQKYAAGAFVIAIELLFDDGQVWIARVASNHHATMRVTDETLKRRLLCEVATLKVVRDRTAIPAPTVFGFSEDKANPIGLPYIMMSAIVGFKPEDVGIAQMWSDMPVPPDKQPLVTTYCASLAAIQVELSRVTFDSIGSLYLDDSGEPVVGPETVTGIPPCASPAEYFALYGEYILGDALRSEDAKGNEDRLFGVWLVRLLLSSVSVSASRGPYRLTHQDLSASNTLVDKAGEIVGVIDWDTAACLPDAMFAGQALDCSKDMDNDYAERRAWFDAYNSALRALDPGLARLHASTSAQLLCSLNFINDPETYSRPFFYRSFCLHLLGTEDWESVRRSPVFREWLSTL
ncbi:hypothetical protein AURDEDRAFT_145829 [Auricularia subglabra TFB-10046 SS5]|nr:hypothetical protein AURDEDRAFT_145829 [Auricularia subglabra TFB-10046 SS5]